ncbi:MAG TPA: hypothetical protein VHT24_02735 [Pseudacidobacterium sp.]|jgi:hypothetical protein|nr:hypothetical protein [Pseudacidobacterium sp.]
MKRFEQSHRFAGPPLLPVAVVHVSLFAASLAVGAILRHGQGFANPYGPIEDAQKFYTSNPEALRWSAFFFFGSAVPLGIYTATIVARLRFLGVRAAGTYITLFGGFTTAIAIAVSALCSWVLSVPEVNSSVATLRLMHFLSFLAGGVAFAVGFGLLAAGVSVTSFFARLLPRWLVWFGLLIAVAGELSSISLVAYPMNFMLPVTRFGGFFWLIAVAALMPKGAENAPVK